MSEEAGKGMTTVVALYAMTASAASRHCEPDEIKGVVKSTTMTASGKADQRPVRAKLREDVEVCLSISHLRYLQAPSQAEWPECPGLLL